MRRGRSRRLGAPALSLLALFTLLSASAAAAETQKVPLVFYHEEFGVKQLGELRAKYDFDEYMAKGADEFERMNLLKRWTYDTVTYGGAKKYVQLRNALTILEKAKRGEVFWCNNIGAVYMQCALSMGYTCRYVFLRNPLGESHIANDIWSNQYRKWVFIDATWNIHLEKDGVPLSLAEMKAEWLKNDAADVVYVYGAGDNERRFVKSQLPIQRQDNYLYRLWPVTDKWISFMYEVALVGRNDLFTHEDGTGNYIWDTIYTLKDDSNSKDTVWEFRRYPSPPLSAVFHELNRVYISQDKADKDSKARSFRLESSGPGSYTPNFESFEVRVDSGDWRDSGPAYSGDFKPGKHVLEARVRNKFGVTGPIGSLEFAVSRDLWPF